MSMMTTLSAMAVGHLGSDIKAGKGSIYFPNSAPPRLNRFWLESTVLLCQRVIRVSPTIKVHLSGTLYRTLDLEKLHNCTSSVDSLGGRLV